MARRLVWSRAVPPAGFALACAAAVGGAAYLATGRADVAVPIGAGGAAAGAAAFGVVRRAESARRDAEDRARAGDERFRAIVDSATDFAIFSTDPAGVITTWNAGAERVFGWAEADIVGRPAATVFTPEDRAAGAPDRELATAARDGRAADERWHLRADGRRFFASGMVTPVRGPGGGVTGFTKVARDATAQREAELAAAENRRFLRSSLDALSAHIAVLDGRGVILEVNAAWRRFADRNDGAADDPVGRDYLAACDAGDGDCDADGPAVAAGIRAVLAGDRADYARDYPCHAPGEERWYQVRVTRFDGPDGARAVVAHEDVTARALATRAAAARSDQLKRLAGVAAHVNVATDVGSVVGVVTRAARELVGAHQAATVLLPAPDGPGAQAATVSARHPDWADYRPAPGGGGFYSAANGLDVPVRMTAAELEAHPGFEAFAAAGAGPPLRGLLAVPLLGRGGEPVGLIQLSDKEHGEFSADDEHLIVQLAQMAAVAAANARLVGRLIDEDRQKNEFLAMLAHELRNPLAPIRSAVEVMRLAPDRPDLVATARDAVGRQLTQMVRLVDDLLDVSRVSRGTVALDRRPVDLRDVVRTAVETSRPVLDAAEHELTLDLPARPLTLDADPTRVAQVVGNLITNAAKYTPPGGRVTVAVARDRSDAVVRVTDTGVGLPADMLAKVFDLFTQVDTSLERSQGGLGIGLTLVKRLVELHGGSVCAGSPGPGLGSTFTVRLPALPATATPSAPDFVLPPEAPPAPARLRVLVADDNADSAETLALLLSIQGHDVRTAPDGRAAVEVADRFHPDVVLTDVGMPRLNGYEVVRHVRRQPWAANTVVAVLTGWGQNDDRDRSAAAGVDFHLVKPVDPDLLARVLASAAARG